MERLDRAVTMIVKLAALTLVIRVLLGLLPLGPNLDMPPAMAWIIAFASAALYLADQDAD